MNPWRAASPDDDVVIAAMFLQFNLEDPGQEPVSPENMPRTLAALREHPERGRALVLEADGSVAGYALLIAFWSNELGGECCCLDELFVAPRARGRGHASTLIQALAEGSPLWPREAVALVLEVSTQNARAAALYRRHGFRGGNLALRLPRRRALSSPLP